jgi:hypothetical protein
VEKQDLAPIPGIFLENLFIIPHTYRESGVAVARAETEMSSQKQQKQPQVNEEYFTKMKIKLMISRDQWKELKAHMYWTFIMFSAAISLALLSQTLTFSSEWSLEQINYSQLLNALISFSMVLILFSSTRFQSRLSLCVGIATILHVVAYLSCMLRSMTLQSNLKPLQDLISETLQMFLVTSEIDYLCSELNGTSPVGAFMYWTIFLFSAYMEGNYLKTLTTLKEFEELELSLKKLNQKQSKSEKKGEKEGKKEKEKVSEAGQKIPKEENKKKKKKSS